MKKAVKLSFYSILCAVVFFSCKEKEEQAAPLPVAEFSYTADVGNPLNIKFTDQSKNAESHSWNFGDQKGTSVEKNPSYIYSAAGTYVVSLTVTNLDGKTAKKEQNVIVQPLAPVANFTFEIDESDPLKVHFTNASQNATVYSWNFGDGSTPATEDNPTHVYAASGTYSVSLTAQNNNLQSNAKTTDVTVTATSVPESAVKVKIGNTYTDLVQQGDDEIYEAVVPFTAGQHTFTIYIANAEHGFIWYSGNGGIGAVIDEHASVPLADIYVEKSLGRLAPATDEDLIDTSPLWVNTTSGGDVLVRVDMSQTDEIPRYYLELQKSADPNLILEQNFDLFVWGGHWPYYMTGSIPTPNDPASVDGTEVATRSGTGTAIGTQATSPLNNENAAMLPYLKNRGMEGWSMNCIYEMAGYVRLSNSASAGIEYRGILKTPALTELAAPTTITVKYDACRFAASEEVIFKVEGDGTISSATYKDVLEEGITYGGGYTPTTSETDITVGGGATSFGMTTAISPPWSGVNSAIKYWTRFTVTVAGATSNTKIVWDATEGAATSAQYRFCIDNISIRK
ncbi:MAG: PKD domain-containing protein [Bacteroidales bacterium]|jgi:PKD repeat protein|nr:PKD domain-containing protein [Bacteroidales bacterium]